MSTKKNDAHSAKVLPWGKQKKGEPAQPQQGTAGSGSHFAAASPVADQAVVPQRSKYAHVKITGASGEMPKVPVRVHTATAAQYSRYNERYGTGQSVDSAAPATKKGFSTKAEPGQPAYSWVPFLAYGGVSIAAILAWVVCAKLLAAPLPVPGDFVLTCALALLCLVVVAGIVVIAVTVAVTRRNDESLMSSDIVSSALLKGSLSICLSVAVWVAALYVVTTLAL